MTGGRLRDHLTAAPDGQWAERLIPFSYLSHRKRDPAAKRHADMRKTVEVAAKRRLGDIIVEHGLITAEQLEHALLVQRESGAKLGEVLVELGFITRVCLAGVITEQWDELGLTTSGRKAAGANGHSAVPAGSTPAERALHERVESLTVELAARDQRIAQQDATISALLAQLSPAA
jgi:hypothetical protein